MAGICLTPLREDRFRGIMETAHATIIESRDRTTLQSIPELVDGVRHIFSAYSDYQLDFLAAFADAPHFVTWLLQHSNQTEFNEMLNVVRPCTDEPRMISAIASLVAIRMLLLEPLYQTAPYKDLEALMKAFCGVDGVKYHVEQGGDFAGQGGGDDHDASPSGS